MGQERFVVGLGNPGRGYGGSRHNVGFRVVDALTQRWALGEGRKAFRGRFYEGRPTKGRMGSVRVMLLKPHTYMNRSGQAVREMTAFYKAVCQQVLIVLDDLALPVGQLRMRAGGSCGGHKGLADVVKALGDDDVPRLRIGIGSPPAYMDPADFVLGRFETDELEKIAQAIQLAADAVEDWVFNGVEYVMNKYNRAAED